MDRTPRLLPVVQTDLLQRARIESPCHADWNAMQGDDVRRDCEECQLSVLHLSRLPRAKAEEALRNRGERLCVRMTVDRNGRVLSAEDLEERRARRQPSWWKRAVSWLLLAFGGAGFTACIDRSGAPPVVPPAGHTQNPDPVPELMGEVCIPEDQVRQGASTETPDELEVMGDVAFPEDELSPNETEPHELMGRVVSDTRTFMGTPVFVDPEDETGEGDDKAGDDNEE